MGENQNANDEKKPFPTAFFADFIINKVLYPGNAKRSLSNYIFSLFINNVKLQAPFI
ncbi:hypothetical protein QFZ51_001423 [Chitinophaga sp. W3I9]